mgnify:CR=1 FL=1
MKMSDILRAFADTLDATDNNTDNAPDNDQSGLPNNPVMDVDSNPVMISPQQQELELAKANLGKQSPVIDKLTQPDNIGAEDGGDTLKRIVHLSKSQ